MTEVEINKSIKLSEHMKLGELTVTSVKTVDKRKAGRLTAGEDKGIVMGLIGWDGVLG